MHKAFFAVLWIWAGGASAQEVVIAMLGDSLTQGFGLAMEDGLVPQLETWLEQQGANVRLINAGVSGDTTAGGLARVEWTLSAKVDAMVVALGGNDMLRGLAPEVSRANLEGILQAAQAADVEVLLVGMNAPGNYGPTYQTAFNAIYPDLSQQYGTLYMADFFGGLRGADSEPAAIAKFMQRDGLHPNQEGVRRILDQMGPYVLALIEAVDR